jgi:HPt (histidine-containing phosphotransfer) domain-containing protein
MLRDFSDLSLPITVSPHDRDACRLLEDRAHKLKGSAGMIGATGVMRYAGAVERALQESRPPEAVEGILKKLAAALTTLKDEAKVMLDEAPLKTASACGDPSNDPCIDSADLDEFCSLLECQNLAAVDQFALMSPRLAELLGATQFERLRDAVENLDFQIGAELLRGQAPSFMQPKGDGGVDFRLRRHAHPGARRAATMRSQPAGAACVRPRPPLVRVVRTGRRSININYDNWFAKAGKYRRFPPQGSSQCTVR